MGGTDKRERVALRRLPVAEAADLLEDRFPAKVDCMIAEWLAGRRDVAASRNKYRSFNSGSKREYLEVVVELLKPRHHRWPLPELRNADHEARTPRTGQARRTN